jgi:hypothetical protein
MKRIAKRKHWQKHGVSEIVGNLLILGITVTLFSSIMIFVSTMPTPSEEVYTDFGSSVDIGTDYANVTITHEGGQTLKDFRTNIYLFIDGTPQTLKFSDFHLSSEWKTGQTGWYNVSGVSSSTSLSLMVVDTEANSVVYDVTLRGQQTSFAPIIESRGTSPSTLFVGTTFTLFVKVTDPDGNLNTASVYANASSLGASFSSVPLTDSNNDGIFTSAQTFIAQSAWSGKEVIFNASDMTGKNTTGRFVITITTQDGGSSYYGPYYNYSSYLVNGTYPPDVSGGESGGTGGAVGTTFYYVRNADTLEITRDFEPGDAVMIEVYSNSLMNLALENNFYMYHPLTGDPMVPPTKSDAFEYGGIYATFNRYVYNFSAPIAPLIYTIQMNLKDNTGTVVNIADTIRISGADYPAIEVLRVNRTTGQFESPSSFNHTDTLYVRIITQSVESNLDSVYVGTVEISDYTGKYIIKKVPADFSAYPTTDYSAPISSLFKTNATGPTRLADNTVVLGTAYTIYLKPQDAYQGWWLPRTNAYTLKVSIVSEMPGETYHDLTLQMNITAPLSTTDIVTSIGSGSYTWSASAAQWDDSALAWFSSTERSDQWKKTTIDPNTYNGPIAMVLSDIDNDGYDDLVVGFQDSSVSLVWYRNEKPDGSEWSETPYLISAAFDARTGVQAAETSSKGSTSEDDSVWVYRTSWPTMDRFYPDDGDYTTTEICADMAAGDFDGDGDDDVVASFVHAVTFTTASSRSNAGPSNSYGMFFNRGVYVFWNDGSWTRTTLYSTSDWLANGWDNEDRNSGIMDLDTGDFNQDGYDDIVGVSEADRSGNANGATFVWFSRYLESSGDKQEGAFGTPSSYVELTPTVAGKRPWDTSAHYYSTEYQTRFPKVDVANIDSNGYPDIIRTSTASNTISVFLTMPSSSSTATFYPSGEFSPGPGVVAHVTGSIANLTANDTGYENLTEVWKNYPMDIGKPQQVGAPADTTGHLNTTDIRDDDGVTYNVGGDKKMCVTLFDINNTHQTKVLSNATLRVKYAVEADYLGSENITITTTGWGVDLPTDIKPLSSQTEMVTATYDLLAAGVNTWEELNALSVKLQNSGAVDDGAVLFDYVWVEAYFVEGTQLDWVWTLENDYDYPFHQLTVVAKCLETNGSFYLQYSLDNTTWLNLTDLSDRAEITGTTELTYTYSIAHSTQDTIYLRVRDSDASAADAFNNTICMNMISLEHYTPQVSWSNSDRYDIAASDLSVGEYITAIAVGDLGKFTFDYRPDGFPDIIATTSKVGGGDSTHSVYLFPQNLGGGGFSNVMRLDTPDLAAQVTDNAVYNIMNVALGDIDGDYDLDIVLVVGYAPGRSGGTAPTLWLLENEPLPGGWQFDDRTINVLGTGESAINVVTGYVDLTIFIPFMGVLGIVMASAVTEYVRRRRE